MTIPNLYTDIMTLINQGYYTKTETDNKYATQTQITNLRQDITALQNEDWKIQIVSTLPANPTTKTFYFIRNNENTGTDLYDEYIYNATNNQWEKIGSIGVTIDLSDYVKKEDVGLELQGDYLKIVFNE